MSAESPMDRPSEEMHRRVSDLIHREKTVGLSPDETAELDGYLEMEHRMRMAKVRWRIAQMANGS